MKEKLYRIVQTSGFILRGITTCEVREDLGVNHETAELAREAAQAAGITSYYICDQNGVRV
jgi:hypothetical protein